MKIKKPWGKLIGMWMEPDTRDESVDLFSDNFKRFVSKEFKELLESSEKYSPHTTSKIVTSWRWYIKGSYFRTVMSFSGSQRE